MTREDEIKLRASWLTIQGYEDGLNNISPDLRPEFERNEIHYKIGFNKGREDFLRSNSSPLPPIIIDPPYPLKEKSRKI